MVGLVHGDNHPAVPRHVHAQGVGYPEGTGKTGEKTSRKNWLSLAVRASDPGGYHEGRARGHGAAGTNH